LWADPLSPAPPETDFWLTAGRPLAGRLADWEVPEAPEGALEEVVSTSGTAMMASSSTSATGQSFLAFRSCQTGPISPIT
jgi:hypothetical protein